MQLRDHKVNLLILTILFLMLYLPIIGRPFTFEELRLTSFFHTPPIAEITSFTPELQQGSRLSQYWRDYVEIYPPGVLIFYRAWSFISLENETFMRLPLFLLIIWSLVKLFQFMSLSVGKSESSLLTLLIGLSPLWYGYSGHLTPEAFAFPLFFLSIFYYHEAIQRKNFSSLSLWIVNTLGLFTLYHFSFLVLAQIIGSFFCKKYDSQKTFAGLFILLVTTVLSTFVLIASDKVKNPLVFYWPEIDGSEVIKLFKLMILGSS